MKKYLSKIILIAFFIGNIGFLGAEDLTPSESYYKNNIAINEVSAKSPSLKAGGDEDDPDPSGDHGGDGGQVNAPIGDALLPLLIAGLAYASFILVRKRKVADEK